MRYSNGEPRVFTCMSDREIREAIEEYERVAAEDPATDADLDLSGCAALLREELAWRDREPWRVRD